MSEALIANALPPWLILALEPCLTLTKVLELSHLTAFVFLDFLDGLPKPYPMFLTPFQA